MKLSLYNTWIEVTPETGIVYNALADSFLPINNPDFTILKNAERQTLPDGLGEKLIKALKKCGAVVDDDTDEPGIVAKMIEKTDNRKDSFTLHINPTLDCNFKCWYCYENHVSGSLMTKDCVESCLKLIDSILDQEDLKELRIGFFGGEPLIGFDIVCKPIIEHAAAQGEETGKKVDFSFTSNSFLLTDEMVEFLHRHPAHFQITLDGSREYHNKTRFGKGGVESYDTIVDNIRKLAGCGCETLTRVNYTGKNALSIPEIVDDFSRIPEDQRKGISFTFHRVWQDAPRHNDESEEETRITGTVTKAIADLRKMGYPVSDHRDMDGVRSPCYGDMRNYVLVNFNGDLFQCTARDFKTDNRAGYLADNGEIVWENDAKNRRMTTKFSKEVCRSCRIAPLCGGGCRQQAVEHLGEDSCIYSYTNEDMDAAVLRRIENFISR